MDREYVAACLAKDPLGPRECLFSASDPCQQVEVKRAANQLQARMWCDYREMFVWREIREAVLRELMASLPETERATLQAQQDDWVVYNRTACRFPYDFLAGPWVHAEKARCALEHEQRRTADLLIARDHLKSDEFTFQAK